MISAKVVDNPHEVTRGNPFVVDSRNSFMEISNAAVSKGRATVADMGLRLWFTLVCINSRTDPVVFVFDFQIVVMVRHRR